MFNKIGIVFRKELTDSLRDRRTLFGALFYPLFGPLLMLVFITVLGRSSSASADRPLSLPLSGAEHAPNLVTFLRQNGAVIEPAPADPEHSVLVGDVDVVVIIPPDFDEDFNAGRPATVRLVVDDSRQAAGVSVGRARRLLDAYSSQVGALRLLARGVDPSVAGALAIETVDVATAQSQAALLLNILPYFMIFAVFTSGMGLVIDVTAGERERGSLEPLVVNPVSRAELVLGKMGVALVFTLFGVLETLAAFGIMLNFLPLADLGLRASLPLASLLGILGLMLPLMLVAAALQFIIATFTRSFKEAQNYLSLLPLVPALPGMFLAFVPVRPELWTMLIPTFGQQLLIIQLMRGESPAAINVAVVTLVSLVLGVVLVAVAVRLYQREQVLFGK